jgi:hypothetical protein
MSIQDLERAFELIELMGDGDVEGKKETALVEKAEKCLGLSFPNSYKIFLETLGYCGIKGLEFYGIFGDDFENSGVPDAIWLTLKNRKTGLPHSFVIVSSLGNGTYYALDTSQLNADGECPVVTYEINGRIEKIADDFGEFLLSELDSMKDEE